MIHTRTIASQAQPFGHETRSGTDPLRLIGLGVLILSIAAKLGIFAIGAHREPGLLFAPDSLSYIQSARALVATGRFAISPEQPQIPQLIRTPGYPVFLAAVFALAGERWGLVVMGHIIFNVGTLLLTYLLSKRLWHSATAAMAAAALLAADLPFLMSSHYILTEAFFTCTLCLALYALTRLLTQPRPGLAMGFVYGGTLAVTTLIRPITAYLLPPILLLIIFHLWHHLRLTWRAIALMLACVCVPYVILVGGWQFRNYRLTGQAEFSYIQGANLLFYRGAGILAQRDQVSFEAAQQRLGYQEYQAMSAQPDALVAAHARWKRASLTLFRQYPVFLLKDLLRGSAKMLGMPGEDGVLRYMGALRQTSGPLGDLLALSWKSYLRKWGLENPGHFLFWGMGIGYLGIVYGGILLALMLNAKPRDIFHSRHLALWLTVGYLVAVSAGPGAYYRFRIPIMPILCLYAAYGWQTWIHPKTHVCKFCQEGDVL